MDDTTLMEVVPKGESSNIQSTVSDIQNQSYALKFTSNDDKSKEMRIQFNKCNTSQLLNSVTINGKQAGLIFESKVLGLTIRSALKRKSHIDNIVKNSIQKIVSFATIKTR